MATSSLTFDEASIDSLQRQFQKAEVELNQISKKLELQIQKNWSATGDVNPFSLLQRINLLQTELSELYFKIQNLLNSKQEAEEWGALLSGNYGILFHLCQILENKNSSEDLNSSNASFLSTKNQANPNNNTLSKQQNNSSKVN